MVAGYPTRKLPLRTSPLNIMAAYAAISRLAGFAQTPCRCGRLILFNRNQNQIDGANAAMSGRKLPSGARGRIRKGTCCAHLVRYLYVTVRPTVGRTVTARISYSVLTRVTLNRPVAASQRC